ncbi:hypothetical protein [Azorhizobium sp. AG788]|uniref:hypothetical protein n=1 Tax=Azorhizobium sp. AG788 TaxID=2183897 RepID=UPI0031386C40
MKTCRHLFGALALACGALTAAGAGSALRAADAPPYMNIIVGGAVPSAAETAKQDVLALNTAMFALYADSGKIIAQNIQAQHPIILALFSGSGGRLLLYRPGHPRLEAPSVPEVYQLLKSIGHSTMVLSVLAGPHVDKPTDASWIAPMQAFRAEMQAALDGLSKTSMPADWQPNNIAILKDNIAFMDDSLAKKVITFDALAAFAAKQGPQLKKSIAWAAETQVKHWMGVLAEWKTMLGADWDKTYGASNTIYVARQNNILYSVLAQFFGADAINTRLMLIETVSFTTTPEDMLGSLTRIIADRTVGGLFFGNTAVMDYELMGGDARAAIIADATKRGMTPFLPPLVPFGSKQWPTLITPGPGPATLSQLP